MLQTHAENRCRFPVHVTVASIGNLYFECTAVERTVTNEGLISPLRHKKKPAVSYHGSPVTQRILGPKPWTTM